MQKRYETQRLILTTLDPSAAEAVLDYYIRNKEFFKEWEPTRGDEFYTLPYHEKQLEDEHELLCNGNSIRLWIYKKEDSDRLIGTIAFSNIVRGVFLSCHLGYKLDQEEVNNGYITEALRKGIEIMFGEYGLHRIEANIMPKNKRSLRVVEKLGFYDEGLAVKYLKINGNWEDHIHMVLRNEAIESE